MLHPFPQLLQVRRSNPLRLRLRQKRTHALQRLLCLRDANRLLVFCAGVKAHRAPTLARIPPKPSNRRPVRQSRAARPKPAPAHGRPASRPSASGLARRRTSPSLTLTMPRSPRRHLPRSARARWSSASAASPPRPASAPSAASPTRRALRSLRSSTCSPGPDRPPPSLEASAQAPLSSREAASAAACPLAAGPPPRTAAAEHSSTRLEWSRLPWHYSADSWPPAPGPTLAPRHALRSHRHSSRPRSTLHAAASRADSRRSPPAAAPRPTHPACPPSAAAPPSADSTRTSPRPPPHPRRGVRCASS